MPKAYDPSDLSIDEVMYVTPTSDSRPFIFAYEGGEMGEYQTLAELNPKGINAEPETLNTTPPW